MWTEEASFSTKREPPDPPKGESGSGFLVFLVAVCVLAFAAGGPLVGALSVAGVIGLLILACVIQHL